MRTFDTFQPGQLIGSVETPVSDRDLAQWFSLFPDASDDQTSLPPGLVISMMMRGYIQILGERPQGNVHASQELEWLMPAPKNDPLVVTLKCVKKEQKDNRRWLWLENGVATKTGAMCLKGTMRMLWAA